MTRWGLGRDFTFWEIKLVVRYVIRDVEIREVFGRCACEGRSEASYMRHLSVVPHMYPLRIALSEPLGQVLQAMSARKVASFRRQDGVQFELIDGDGAVALGVDDVGVMVLRLRPSLQRQEIRVLVSRGAGGIHKAMADELRQRPLRFPNNISDARGVIGVKLWPQGGLWEKERDLSSIDWSYRKRIRGSGRCERRIWFFFPTSRRQ
ncbi:MAG: hypothetical protein M2R45_01897 [Verrucomicrobia subdivision 3 bacterium]|nr:hypothetical protein [Limisphaerales bacterium]MCS1415695.1 hypothetical protein [Limisphaerales bacterium]